MGCEQTIPEHLKVSAIHHAGISLFSSAFFLSLSLMTLHTINTGLFKLDGGAMHGVVPKSMWQKVNPADENNDDKKIYQFFVLQSPFRHVEIFHFTAGEWQKSHFPRQIIDSPEKKTCSPENFYLGIFFVCYFCTGQNIVI